MRRRHFLLHRTTALVGRAVALVRPLGTENHRLVHLRQAKLFVYQRRVGFEISNHGFHVDEVFVCDGCVIFGFVVEGIEFEKACVEAGVEVIVDAVGFVLGVEFDEGWNVVHCVLVVFV